jgi:hypothetical protein
MQDTELTKPEGQKEPLSSRNGVGVVMMNEKGISISLMLLMILSTMWSTSALSLNLTDLE